MKQSNYCMRLFRKGMIVLCTCLSLLSRSYGQVNLQTGSATFSLPMFNWQDDKSRLNSVVALSYNSGNGLKVNDVASNVGQGWSLVAGGVITRMQLGEPDDQIAHGSTSEYDLTKFPPGYLNATVPAGNGCPAALLRYPLYKSMNTLYAQHNQVAEDKQLDYFAFQFNGKSGMFILDPTNGDNGVMLGDSKIKIHFSRADLTSQGIRTTITSFTIQDVDGLIYTFSQKALTKVMERKYCDGNLVAQQSVPKFHNGRVYHEATFTNSGFYKDWVVNAWYLTKITDPLTEREVDLTYNITDNQDLISGEDLIYNNGDKEYVLVSHKRTVAQTPELTAISYPDGHSVSFSYGFNRPDYPGGTVLQQVSVQYSGRYLSQYQLHTTYFILNRYGVPTSPDQLAVARLCLRSVTKLGVDLKEDTPPYTFDYYLGSSAANDVVPPPNTYSKDVWGYYNADNNKSFNGIAVPANGKSGNLNFDQIKGLCFTSSATPGIVLNPKEGYAKNGLLRQVIYPTGGTLTYEYAQNWGTLDGTTYRMVGGVHVSKTSSTDGGYSNGCDNAISTSYNFIDSVGNSSLWGLELPYNEMDQGSHYSPEDKKYHWTWSCLPFGCCYYKYMYPGILQQQQATNLSNFQHGLQVVTNVLGVLSVITTVMDIVTVVGGGNPVSLIIDIIGGLITIGITCLHDYTTDSYTAMYYNYDLNAVSPLPAQFRRVEIVENPGTIGKTVHEFTSSDDYAIWSPTNPALSSKQRFAPWAYGLPKRITVYDANGKKVKQTQNFYNFFYAKSLIEDCFKCVPGPSGITSTLLSCKCLVQHTESQRYTDWETPPATYQTSSDGNMKVDIYGLYTGRVELYASYDRTYKTGDDTKYAEARSYFYYDEPTHHYEMTRSEKQESDGSMTVQYYKYTSDYSSGLPYTMAQNNIIALPVEIDVWKNSNPLNAHTTNFVQLANGDIKPSDIVETRFSAPGVGGTNATVQSFTYDLSGNLIGMMDEGQRQVTNIYGYNDKYVVASVINSDPLADHAAYTSFEDAGLGGWTYTPNGNPAAYSGSSMTGTRSFVLASGATFSATLNTAKPYTLSFWSTANTISVSGATLSKSAPTINGFTYYEYDIAQGTGSVTVGGSGTLDELRLHPKMARMHTVTYDPLIGKTSESDENGRITYYEYDDLGRLLLVKDDHKNVLKMYEYNNVSPAKLNGCPGIYYSHYAKETFTKNDCPSGYVGSEVTYTVPADKYMSYLSQEDADAQVDLELQANGQAYANTNGTCLRLYCNSEHHATDSTQSCGDGYAGGWVTYTVPEGKYCTTISQEAADSMAQDDVDANAQTYANDTLHAVCRIDTTADWTRTDTSSTYCTMVGGENHLMVLAVDLNPNSPTYLHTQWMDAGVQPDACPTIYYNDEQSGTYRRSNCGSGYVGSAVTYTVAANTYSSTVSKDAANQLARDDVNANGQSYANSHGTCTTCSSSVTINTGWALNSGSISANSATVSFSVVIHATSTSSYTDIDSGDPATVVVIAVVNTCLRPSATRTMSFTESGRNWTVTVFTNGKVSLHYDGGSGIPAANTAISLTGGSYNL